jgi:polysaccharide biosynthesis protein PslH
VKLLFVKHTLGWPRASGHDVHTFEMIKACAELGHEVGLATVAETTPEAVGGVSLALQTRLTAMNGSATNDLPYSRLQERFRSYWGVDRPLVASLRAERVSFRPDAVVVVGLEALPFLAAVEDAVRVWYAADEWVLHHLTLIQALAPSTWSHMKTAAVKGLYERAYSPLVDRAWVVSTEERRAMRWLAGVRNVDVVPNGVDGSHYRPGSADERPFSAVFWGRLDFAPNVQALQWFCRQVWPLVRRQVPQACLTIIGFRPVAAVQALAAEPGVAVKADLPDLRPEVSRQAVVVLPFVSGGGIKNKLLEAAAMAKPIVCSRRATSGLKRVEESSLILVDTPEDWVTALVELWSDAERRDQAGRAARNWVLARHTWTASATEALRGISESLARRGPP